MIVDYYYNPEKKGRFPARRILIKDNNGNPLAAVVQISESDKGDEHVHITTVFDKDFHQQLLALGFNKPASNIQIYQYTSSNT